MEVKFEKMCDRCFRILGDNEKMYAMKMIDDEGQERIFKGHEGCMNEVVEILTQLYGTKEQNEDDNR